MSRLRQARRARRDGSGWLWRWVRPAGHLALILRLSFHFLHEEPSSIDSVSDMDAATLCKIVYRDPHTTARANVPDTCPVYVGGLGDGVPEEDKASEDNDGRT